MKQLKTIDNFWQTKREDLDRMEIELKVWQKTPHNDRVKLAKHIASKAQTGTLPVASLNGGMQYDPNTYNRVFSRLSNAVETPEDYGFKDWKHTLATL